MKGMILTFCIICFGCAIFCAGIFLHSDEMQLDEINHAMKRSIRSSMEIMADRKIEQRTAEEALDEFMRTFKILAPQNIHYSAGIYGFCEHPLLMRIRVISSNQSGKSYSFEETMVEEVIKHEK